MRVDSQLDDKDMREKMRLMKAYSPLDFGIEHEFCCIVGPTSNTSIEKKEEDKDANGENTIYYTPKTTQNIEEQDMANYSLTNPQMLSINQSGLKSASMTNDEEESIEK